MIFSIILEETNLTTKKNVLEKATFMTDNYIDQVYNWSQLQVAQYVLKVKIKINLKLKTIINLVFSFMLYMLESLAKNYVK